MPFARVNGALCANGQSLAGIAAATGTPVYVYSWPAIRQRYDEVAAALAAIPHQICYAVKANSNLRVLTRLAELGAGFDIVSGGELERVRRAGGDPRRVVFSGVGKSLAELDAAIGWGIGFLGVESASELHRVNARANALGKRARVAIRVNPDLNAGAHPYIATGLKATKFGLPPDAARALCRRAAASPALEIVGVSCHIGSQIDSVAPFQAALTTLLDLVDGVTADGARVQFVDIGGGFGVRYNDETPLSLDAFGRMAENALAGRKLTLVVEPGRHLVADAGVLMTRVEYLKPGPGGRGFAVVDAAMNDLIRPALYQAWHAVESVVEAEGEIGCWDIVGPVCESGDFLARERELALREGDLLAVRGAGAYGFALSSNYNSRRRAAEVLVDDDGFNIVRRRETVEDMLRLEAEA